MRKVHLVSSLLLALSASMFGLGCGGGTKEGGGSMSGGATPGQTSGETVVAEVSPLVWLPAETEAMIQVKVADLWKAPLFKSLTGTPQAADFVTEMESKTGLKPADIASITIGAPDLAGIQSAAAAQAIGVAGAPPKGLVGVIKTTKAVTLEDLAKSDEMKTAEHGSKKYLESTEGGVGLYVADSKTVLIASVEDLKAAMDRGENKAPRKELSLVNTGSHLILVAAPKDPAALTANLSAAPTEGAPEEVAAMQQTLAESLTAFGVGLSVSGGLDFDTSLMLSKTDGVDKVKAGITASVGKAKEEFATAKEAAPPVLAELGEMFLNSAKVESDAQVVKFSASIPSSAQDKLEQVPQLVANMFFPGVTLGAPSEGGEGQKGTGRRPKPAGAGSTTGGGVEVPGK